MRRLLYAISTSGRLRSAPLGPLEETVGCESTIVSSYLTGFVIYLLAKFCLQWSQRVSSCWTALLQLMQLMICAAFLAGLDDMQPINIDAVGFN